MCEASEVEGERGPLARKRRVAAETGTGQGQSVVRGGRREDAITQYHPLSPACKHDTRFTARSTPISITFVILSCIFPANFRPVANGAKT